MPFLISIASSTASFRVCHHIRSRGGSVLETRSLWSLRPLPAHAVHLVGGIRHTGDVRGALVMLGGCCTLIYCAHVPAD